MDMGKNIPKMSTDGFRIKTVKEPEPMAAHTENEKKDLPWQSRQAEEKQKPPVKEARPVEKIKAAFNRGHTRKAENTGAARGKDSKPGRVFGFSWGDVAKKSEGVKSALLNADKPVRKALPPIVKGLAVIAAVAAIMLVIKGVDNPVTNTLEDGIQSALGTTLTPDEDIGKLKFVFNDGGQTAQYVYRSSLELPVEGTLAAGDVMGHPGTVFVAESGATVRASAPGTITATGVDEDLGRYVRISHPSGLETVYYGLQEITAGGYVERLQEIGRMADDKLYFEVYQDGRLIDPMPYFEGE